MRDLLFGSATEMAGRRRAGGGRRRGAADGAARRASPTSTRSCTPSSTSTPTARCGRRARPMRRAWPEECSVPSTGAHHRQGLDRRARPAVQRRRGRAAGPRPRRRRHGRRAAARRGAIVMAKTNVGERSEAFGATLQPARSDPDPDREQLRRGGAGGGRRLRVGPRLGLGRLAAAAGARLRLRRVAADDRPRPADGARAGHHAAARPANRDRSDRPPRGGPGHRPERPRGPDHVDPSVVPMPLGDPAEVDLRGLRVAWWDEQPDCDPTPDTRRTVAAAAGWLAAAGAKVVAARPAGLERVYPLTRTLLVAAGVGRRRGLGAHGDHRPRWRRRPALPVRVGRLPAATWPGSWGPSTRC
jgi:hypothetical protein